MAARRQFKTRETCEITGRYRFRGYLDGTKEPPPGAKERKIRIVAGQTFPPIESSEKECWWKLIVP